MYTERFSSDIGGGSNDSFKSLMSGRKRSPSRSFGLGTTRQSVIGILLLVALFAFELFNFDTTRFALSDLLGTIEFLGVRWAAILAIAFCAVDFAGLAHLFTPERGLDEPKEVWYLMGAWLLGATMNAIMTWWAVNLTLLNNQFGNEVLTREQLLQVVPPFVAVLVWLTRILFIGAFSVAGEHFFRPDMPATLPHATQQITPVATGAAGPTSRFRRRSPIPRPTRPEAPALRMSAGRQHAGHE